MPSTAQTLDGDGTDWTAAVRALGARTNNAGTAVTDLAADEDRLINHVLTEGYLTPNAFVVQDGVSGMQVDVGSGTSKADIYVVEGDDAGQHPYLVRMDDATVTITLDAGDADPRIDQIYLVVRDSTYDGGTLTEAQLAYRKGDAAASPVAPGPDVAWDAEVLLASISVSASASTVVSGDITDKRSGSNLTSVLRDSLAARFADVAGDTFTGPVTVQDTLTVVDAITGDSIRPEMATDEVTETAGPTSYPLGVTIMQVTAFAEIDTVVTFNWGDSGRTWQLGMTFGSILYTRRWASTAWTDWREVAYSADVGRFEVDASTEVTSATLSQLFSNVASLTLSIPASWNSWKCEAYGNAIMDTSNIYHFTVVIDGTPQQSFGGVDTTGSKPVAVGGRRTGMTTTGNRGVSLQARAESGTPALVDIYFYARAVRTS